MQKQQLLNKAMLLLQQQKLGPATAIAKKLLKQDSQDFNCLHLYGILLLKQGRLEDAREQLQQAVTRPAADKNLAQAWNNLALVLQQQHDLPAAEQAIARAIRLFSCDPAFYCNQANLADLQGNWPAMAAAFQQAISLDPDSVTARLGYAISLRQQKDFTAAQRQLSLINEPQRDLHWLQEWSLLRCIQQQQIQLRQELESLMTDADLLRGLADYIAEEATPRLAEYLYGACLQASPDDPVASHMLAAIRGQQADRAPASYISQLYDQHAIEFEHRLVERLGYDAPGRATTVLQSLPDFSPQHVLDLGCGTGLMGMALTGCFNLSTLRGLDLSRAMLQQAQEKGCYTALEFTDVMDWQTTECFDLICAMDLLIYLGDLTLLLQRVVQWLTPGGLFICTLEQGDEPLPRLTSSGRFQHSREYMQQLAAECGLTVRSEAQFPLRREGRQTLNGLMLVLQRGNTT